MEKSDILLTIDRFEGEFAVCIDGMGAKININKDLIPPDAKEGDIIEKFENIFIINKEKTNSKFEEIKKLQEILWE